jgi:hypothetical protein
MSDDGWSEVVPQEVGDYYFYGDVSFPKGDPNYNPELSILHIHKISNGVMHVIAGQFFHPETERFYGQFKKVDLELPKL